MTITPQAASAQAREICGLAPIVPVLVVTDPAQARPLAQALVDGGLPALEVTLRTPAALEVIHEMAQVQGGVVGAGTLLTPEDVRAAKEAGAVTMNYGLFINAIISFVIVAFSVFMLVRQYNRLKEKEEEAPKAPPEPPKEEVLLTEIRDLLKAGR